MGIDDLVAGDSSTLDSPRFDLLEHSLLLCDELRRETLHEGFVGPILEVAVGCHCRVGVVVRGRKQNRNILSFVTDYSEVVCFDECETRLVMFCSFGEKIGKKKNLVVNSHGNSRSVRSLYDGSTEPPRTAERYHLGEF
mmetsp:Transcript_19293/g.53808  ORF Transcript_19293/g.53808 Transcript_19293/m.53808 type:complete len:139 (-) Transcript_19293:1066-1482(-)